MIQYQYEGDITDTTNNITTTVEEINDPIQFQLSTLSEIKNLTNITTESIGITAPLSMELPNHPPSSSPIPVSNLNPPNPRNNEEPSNGIIHTRSLSNPLPIAYASKLGNIVEHQEREQSNTQDYSPIKRTDSLIDGVTINSHISLNFRKNSFGKPDHTESLKSQPSSTDNITTAAKYRSRSGDINARTSVTTNTATHNSQQISKPNNRKKHNILKRHSGKSSKSLFELIYSENSNLKDNTGLSHSYAASVVGNPLRTMTSLAKGGFLLSSGPSRRRKGKATTSNSNNDDNTTPNRKDIPRSSSSPNGTTPSITSITSPSLTSTSTPKSSERSKETARMASMLMNLRYADENSKIIDYQAPQMMGSSPKVAFPEPLNTGRASPTITGNGRPSTPPVSSSSFLPSSLTNQANRNSSPSSLDSPNNNTSPTSRQILAFSNNSQNRNSMDSVTGGNLTFNYHPSPVYISATTKARAIRAKAKLELQYEMIGEYQTGKRRTAISNSHEDTNSDNDAKSPDDTIDSSIDESPPLGVCLKERTTYNPLQVIRNRIAKKQQGQAYLNYMANKSWNFLWNIDVSELVSDYAWRSRYEHVMRDRRGRLLYPDTNSEESYSHDHEYEHEHNHRPSKHHHRHDSGDLLLTSGSAYSSKHTGDDFLQRIKSRLSSRPTSGINSNDNSDSSWSRSDLSDLEDNRQPRRRDPKKNSDSSSRRNSESPTRKVPFESMNSKGKYSNTVSQKKLSIPVPPLPSDPNNAATTALSESPYLEPSKPNSNGIVESSAARRLTPSTSSTSSLPSREQQDKLSYYANELKYLDMVYELSYLQISRKPYWYVENLNQDAAENMSTEMMTLSKQFEVDLIPKERQYLASTEQEMRKLQFDLTQDHGNRLDSVLLDSDRILNEVNTSLSLEIRKVGQRLDKLEADAPTLQWMWKFGYILLEWLLVAFMWLAWGVVVGLRQIKLLLTTTYGIIMWLFWFS